MFKVPESRDLHSDVQLNTYKVETLYEKTETLEAKLESLEKTIAAKPKESCVSSRITKATLITLINVLVPLLLNQAPFRDSSPQVNYIEKSYQEEVLRNK